MDELTNVTSFSEEEIRDEQARFMARVYAWMCGALCITGLVAYYTANTPEMAMFIVGNKLVFYGLLFAEIIGVMYLVSAIEKISAFTAMLVFVAYSGVNGLTLSVIFLAFTEGSLMSTFFITAATFAIMSLYGYYTKKDLTSWGSLLFTALVGLIIASIVNIMFHNEILYWITTYAGILIFTGLIAYDTQKIKEMNVLGNEGTEEDKKEAIMGALSLYLDFINLFLKLLRLFGKRK